MLDNKDAAKVYDTILSIPGMNEVIKIDFKISRKNVLLLSNVIERGLFAKDDGDGGMLLGTIPKEVLQELTAISADCLQKAGLTELSEKLKSLNSKS